MGDAPEDPERIGWISEGLAGGNSVDLYEGDSKDSYLQPNDRQSIHTRIGGSMRWVKSSRVLERMQREYIGN